MVILSRHGDTVMTESCKRQNQKRYRTVFIPAVLYLFLFDSILFSYLFAIFVVFVLSFSYRIASLPLSSVLRIASFICFTYSLIKGAESFPCSAIMRTMALPTMTASASCAICAACSGVLIPNPMPAGISDAARMAVRMDLRSVRISERTRNLYTGRRDHYSCQHTVRLSPARTLCGCPSRFTSASTVY